MNLTVLDNKSHENIKSGDIVMFHSGNFYQICKTKENNFLGFRLDGAGVIGLKSEHRSIEELLRGLSVKKHYPAGEWELILKRKEGNY